MNSSTILAPTNFFSVVGVTDLGAIVGKPTNECFTDPLLWAFRSGDFDKWLPPDQPDTKRRLVTALTFLGNRKFLERASDVLGLEELLKPSLVGTLLIEGNYVLAATQIEAMAKDAALRKKAGAKVAFGIKNLFFVRTQSVEDPVAVALVDQDDWSQCHANIYRLDDDIPWYGHIPLHVPLQEGSRLL